MEPLPTHGEVSGHRVEVSLGEKDTLWTRTRTRTGLPRELASTTLGPLGPTEDPVPTTGESV